MNQNPGSTIMEVTLVITSIMVSQVSYLITLYLGFDEKTWKHYQEMVKQKADQIEKLKNSDVIKKRL